MCVADGLLTLASSSLVAVEIVCTHGYYVSSASEIQSHHLYRRFVSEVVKHGAKWLGEPVGLSGCKQKLKVQSVIKVATFPCGR